MRFEIPITIESRTNPDQIATIPMSYQGNFLALIKHEMAATNQEAYQKLYQQPTRKNFAMSLSFPNAKFDTKNHTIQLRPKRNVTLAFTTSDTILGVIYFNVFQNLMHSSPLNYNDYYTITFHKAHMVKLPKIYGSSAIFKTTSPIMITNKIDNHKYKMLTIENDWESGEFMNAIKRELKFRLQNSPLHDTVDNMELIPLKTKTVIMHAFGQVLIGNTGYLQINANPKLLNYIFEDGLGSKRGSFCGLLKLLRH